jgi:autotransporter translocation and assembly factor TamB
MEGFMFYDSLVVTMNLSVKPEFRIQNQKYADMEVGLDGSVDVVKEKQGELQLFGTINGRKGFIRTLGKRFKMETAQMQFSGPPDNPSLDMRFSHEPPQPEERIVIYYVITGTLQQPEFSYESEPQMELENIISYTLFGQPYYALESWKQMVARPEGGGGGVASNLMTEALLNRVESLATRKLGVDVVQIENNQSGAGGGTSIKTGWYLNERTFLAILNNISGSTPNTTFILEYMLRKNLELILTQGSESREGIDLHWQKDY